MNCERPFFLFALTVLGILFSTETCFAVPSKHNSSQSLSKQIFVVEVTERKQLNGEVLNNHTDRNLVVQQSEPQEEIEQEETLNKRWTSIGIGVTSIFFCLLLWILFQPNPQSKTTSTLDLTSDTQNDDEQDNEINLLKDLKLELPEEISLPLTEEINLPPTEEISLPPLFTLKEDSLNSKSSEEQTVVLQAHLIRDKQYNPNLTITEDIQDLSPKAEPVQIDAENQGLVQLTNAIDVVFELIQDLKNSDRQLRRKAIWELARTGDSRSIEPLIDTIPLVNSLDKSLILSAISQIAHRNFEPIYDALFTSLQDTNSEVRKDAIRDIIALHESTAKISRHLNTMLKDSDEEVRKTAKWALNRINLNSVSQPDTSTVDKALSTKYKSV